MLARQRAEKRRRPSLVRSTSAHRVERIRPLRRNGKPKHRKGAIHSAAGVSPARAREAASPMRGRIRPRVDVALRCPFEHRRVNRHLHTMSSANVRAPARQMVEIKPMRSGGRACKSRKLLRYSPFPAERDSSRKTSRNPARLNCQRKHPRSIKSASINPTAKSRRKIPVGEADSAAANRTKVQQVRASAESRFAHRANSNERSQTSGCRQRQAAPPADTSGSSPDEKRHRNCA